MPTSSKKFKGKLAREIAGKLYPPGTAPLSPKAIFSLVLLVFMMFSMVTAKAQETEPYVYDDHGRRDPLWRLVSPNGTILNYESDFLITDLALEGIMAGADGKNFAIINGRILKAQDRIGQFVVERIGDDFIVLKKGRRKFELKLKKEE